MPYGLPGLTKISAPRSTISNAKRYRRSPKSFLHNSYPSTDHLGRVRCGGGHHGLPCRLHPAHSADPVEANQRKHGMPAQCHGHCAALRRVDVPRVLWRATGPFWQRLCAPIRRQEIDPPSSLGHAGSGSISSGSATPRWASVAGSLRSASPPMRTVAHPHPHGTI